MAKKPNAASGVPEGPIVPQNNYGLKFNVPLSQLTIELICFKLGHKPSRGGLGRYNHLRNAVMLLWPKLSWHKWLEDQLTSLCEYRYVSWTGCAASGKTYGASLYAMVWWLVDPANSAVILTSTTAKMIRRRQWSAIQDLYFKCPGYAGHMVDSKTTIQARRGDDKHGLFAMPVAEGSVTKAAANIQGIHARRILVIIDEATDTPEAIFEAVSNLEKGCKEFQLLVIGNPQSYFDQHGRFSEPKDGWASVNQSTEHWLTKRGACVRFDGTRSPNILAGKALWPFLITAEQVKSAREHEGPNSPRFWKYTKGFWSPEGFGASVLSEMMCIKFHTMQKIHFYSHSKVLAGLDPAFGGDRCVLRFAKLGDLPNGKLAVQFYRICVLNLDAGSKEPLAYQIASQVRSLCEEEGCLPENLGVDETGNGAGVCDVISATWSARIRRVCFGGGASELPCSQQDKRPAKEVYKNRVTELWYSFREWVQADQIRGLDPDTIKEFCARNYIDRDRKIVLEPKSEMKIRTGQSPDLADAATLVIEVARQLGALSSTELVDDSDFVAATTEIDRNYNEDAFYANEAF